MIRARFPRPAGQEGHIHPEGVIRQRRRAGPAYSTSTLIAATSIVRVAIAVVALALCWIVLVIPAGSRVTFSALVLLVYMPFGLVMHAVRRRWRGQVLARAMVSGDLLIVFVIELLVPSVGVVAMLVVSRLSARPPVAALWAPRRNVGKALV